MPKTSIAVALLPSGLSLEEAKRQPFMPFDQFTWPPDPGFGRKPLDFWVHFGVFNPGKDTLVVWYDPYYVQTWRIAYQQTRGSLQIRTSGHGVKRKGFKDILDMVAHERLIIPPYDTLWFWTVTLPLRNNNIMKVVRIFNEADRKKHLDEETQHNVSARKSGFIVTSILLFMGAFFGLQYIQSKSPIQGWYIAYLMSFTLFFLLHAERIELQPYFLGYFPIILTWSEWPFMALMTLTYLGFISVFFDLRHTQPRTDKFFKWASRLCVFLIGLGILLEVCFYKINYAAILFPYVEVSIQILIISGFVQIIKRRGGPERMVLIGSAILLTTTTISGAIPFEERVSLFGADHLILMKLGVLIEVLLFSTATGIKIKEDAVKSVQLRERIAADLHDEVGSTLSSISILSASALDGLQKNLDITQLTNIGDKARSALDSMSDIVWSVNPENDSMEKVIARMSTYAVDMLERLGTEVRFEISQSVYTLNLPMEKRKDFYLIFKEAIHNCAKYAQAKGVEVTLQKEDNALILSIKDDGVGFDTQHIEKKSLGGNGLRNMRSRAAALGGTLDISSMKEHGTVVLLKVPV